MQNCLLQAEQSYSALEQAGQWGGRYSPPLWTPWICSGRVAPKFTEVRSVNLTDLEKKPSRNAPTRKQHEGDWRRHARQSWIRLTCWMQAAFRSRGPSWPKVTLVPLHTGRCWPYGLLGCASAKQHKLGPPGLGKQVLDLAVGLNLKPSPLSDWHACCPAHHTHTAHLETPSPPLPLRGSAARGHQGGAAGGPASVPTE